MTQVGLRMSVKIKICGITSLTDAFAAVEAGADALGFMFYEKSPRNVSRDTVREIARKLPPFVAKVGVFVNESEETVKSLAADCGLDALQFHGDEPPDFCQRFSPRKIIKAFRIKNAASLSALPPYETDAWLLDSYVPDKLGGSGATFNWELAGQARESGVPIILAGGLTADNVAQAVHEVWPFAVDVSSGVERAPGKKDARLIRDFITAVRSIEREQF